MVDRLTNQYPIGQQEAVGPVQATPQVTGTLYQIPDALRALPIGTLIEAEVQAHEPGGATVIRTAQGEMTLFTSLPLAPKQPLLFSVRQNGAALQLQLHLATGTAKPPTPEAAFVDLSHLVQPGTLVSATFLRLAGTGFPPLLAALAPSLSPTEKGRIVGSKGQFQVVRLSLPDQTGQASQEGQAQDEDPFTFTVMGHNAQGEALLHSPLGILLLHQCPLPKDTRLTAQLTALTLSPPPEAPSVTAQYLLTHWVTLAQAASQGLLASFPTMETPSFLTDLMALSSTLLEGTPLTDTAQLTPDQQHALGLELEALHAQDPLLDDQDHPWYFLPLPFLAEKHWQQAQLYYTRPPQPENAPPGAHPPFRFRCRCQPPDLPLVEIEGLYRSTPGTSLDLIVRTEVALPAPVAALLTQTVHECLAHLTLRGTLRYHVLPLPPLHPPSSPAVWAIG